MSEYCAVEGCDEKIGESLRASATVDGTAGLTFDVWLCEEHYKLIHGDLDGLSIGEEPPDG